MREEKLSNNGCKPGASITRVISQHTPSDELHGSCSDRQRGGCELRSDASILWKQISAIYFQSAPFSDSDSIDYTLVNIRQRTGWTLQQYTAPPPPFSHLLRKREWWVSVVYCGVFLGRTYDKMSWRIFSAGQSADYNCQDILYQCLATASMIACAFYIVREKPCS